MVYIDLVFLLNLLLDFILLLSVTYILNRNIKLRKVLYGSIIGSLSTLLLFIKLNSIELFIIKIFISIIMTIITFSYKNIKYTIKNLEYLYIVSIILGGFLFIAKLQFNNLYIFILLFISPIILYLYYKQTKELKNNYSYYHKLDIYYKDEVVKLNAYLDTGNKLKDPYFNLDIIVINDVLKNIENYILVPIDTIDNHSLLKCIKVDKVLIDNKLIKKVLIGITNKKINMEGIDSIISLNIMEGLI